MAWDRVYLSLYATLRKVQLPLTTGHEQNKDIHKLLQLWLAFIYGFVRCLCIFVCFITNQLIKIFKSLHFAIHILYPSNWTSWHSIKVNLSKASIVVMCSNMHLNNLCEMIIRKTFIHTYTCLSSNIGVYTLKYL